MKKEVLIGNKSRRVLVPRNWLPLPLGLDVVCRQLDEKLCKDIQMSLVALVCFRKYG